MNYWNWMVILMDNNYYILRSRNYIIKQLLDKIKESRFTVHNIEVTSHGCSFEVKQLHGWKFGVWVDDTFDVEYFTEHKPEHMDLDKWLYMKFYEEDGIEFFVQHKDYMDKFKPSASWFRCSHSYADLRDYDRYKQNFWHSELQIIKFIKRHPLIAYCADRHWDYMIPNSYLFEYIKLKCDIHYHSVKYTFRNKITRLAVSSACKRLKRSPLVDSAWIDDSDALTDSMFYMVYLHVRFTEDYSEDEQEALLSSLKVLDSPNIYLVLTQVGYVDADGKNKVYSFQWS